MGPLIEATPSKLRASNGDGVTKKHNDFHIGNTGYTSYFL
jgi:hypothetical protein